MGKITVPEPLNTSHILSKFNCGETSLNEWLRNRGLKSQSLGAARNFVVCREHSSPVIGFYSLATAKVAYSVITCGLKRNISDPITVIILSRLAVDRHFQGKGLGADLLHDAILRIHRVAGHIGISAIMVHVLSDSAKRFYLYHGFTPSLTQLNTLFLPFQNYNKLMYCRF